MRYFYILFLFIVSLIPVSGSSLVRLRDVSQNGYGTKGIIKIEMNGTYDHSKIKKKFFKDHVELILPESFVIPVRRVFSASSSKSSVKKMEANQIPGNAVSLSVYFRVPIEVIKTTAELKGTGQQVDFVYDINKRNLASVNENKEVEKTPVPAVSDISKKVISENNSKQTAIKAESKKEKPGDDYFNSENSKKEKEEGSFLGAILRMVASLAIVLGVMFGGLFLVKKYYKKIPAVSKMVSNKDFKIISSFTLKPGKTLYVIEVMEHRLLIAMTKDNITMLTRLDDQDEYEDDYDEDYNETPDDDFHKDLIKSKLKDRLRNYKGV